LEVHRTSRKAPGQRLRQGFWRPQKVRPHTAILKRYRDIAASLDITERSAFGIITDLAEAGYVIKEKDGRRNRYRIQAHPPATRAQPPGEHTVGEVPALLTGADATTT